MEDRKGGERERGGISLEGKQDAVNRQGRERRPDKPSPYLSTH